MILEIATPLSIGHDQITANKGVLDIIASGHPLHFCSLPLPMTFPPYLFRDSSHESLLQKMASLLLLGASGEGVIGVEGKKVLLCLTLVLRALIK